MATVYGRLPSWLMRTKEGFQFKPGAKHTIEYIYQLTIDGLGGKKLTKKLNQGINRFGYSRQWNETFVRTILTDRRATGEYQPHVGDQNGVFANAGDVIPNYYPPAVSEETWLLANAAIANRRKERGPTGDFINLFTGITFHAIDKCPMHIFTYQQTRADGRKVIYRRLKSKKAIDGVSGASTETVDIASFEQEILRWLKELDLTNLNNTPENRQRLREAIKRVVKRIVILPVKLGTQRRSKIVSLKQIEFHSGVRRTIFANVAQPDEDSTTLSYWDSPVADLLTEVQFARGFLNTECAKIIYGEIA